MKESKGFDTEKKIYIGKVLDHIHYKKLHTRIYEEISTHMDDMYEDFSSNCDDEKEITRKVLDEMGNPHYLGLELKKVNRTKLFWVKIFKIACIFLTLPILYSAYVLIAHIGAEISDYFQADTVEEAEQWLIENRTDGKPIKLLTEIEHEGVVHRIYVPENQDEEYFIIYHIHSTEFFGINVKNRFVRSNAHFESTDTYTIAFLNYPLFTDELHIYFSNPEYKYIKVYFEPFVYGEGHEEYWSDFIEIPQDATIDDPKYFILDSPDGYHWGIYERFDENKEPIENEKFKGL